MKKSKKIMFLECALAESLAALEQALEQAKSAIESQKALRRSDAKRFLGLLADANARANKRLIK